MGKSVGVLLQLVCILCWGLNAQAYFGYAGSDGYDASYGESGRSGPDVELTANGQLEQLILEGFDGEDAPYDGSDGGDATSCYFSGEPSYDVHGAPGGDGGNGGSGGDGGRGGDATIYYQRTADLKSVTIVSRGGRGGNASRGGYGGRGCYCQRHSWTKTYCEEKPDKDGKKRTVCHDRRYYCHQGNSGISGDPGFHGGEGRLGHVTLIKSPEKLQENVTSKNGTLNELLNSEFAFAVNRFNSRSGVLTLLGPASIVDNSYTEYSHRDHYRARILWASNDSLADFQATSTRLFVNGTLMNMNLDSSVWTVVEKSVDRDRSTFAIKQALKVSDVRNISFQIEGKNEDTQLRIFRGAKTANRVESEVQLIIWKDRAVFGDKRVFDGVIDQSRIITVGDDWVVNIGSLPVDAKDLFKPKSKIVVQAIVTRSLQSQSLEVDSGEMKYKVPR